MEQSHQPTTLKEGNHIADISALGNLNSASPIDLPQYKDATESKPIPKKGVYTVRAPESFPVTAFGATKAGFLSAQVDPTILDSSNEGYTIRFTKVSAKEWKDKEGNPVSQLGRYLKVALGSDQVIPGDPQSQADAVEQTASRVYKVLVDWRAYCKDDGFSVEGMEKFPSDGNGGFLPYINHPTLTNPETGDPLLLRANAYVARFLGAD